MGARVARERVDAVIELLLEILDQAFDRKGWHGTTLRGSLRTQPSQHLGAYRPRRVLEVCRSAATRRRCHGIVPTKTQQLAPGSSQA